MPVRTWKPLSTAWPIQPRVLPRVASASSPGQPSCAGTTTSLGAAPRVAVAARLLRVVVALCASMRSRASAG